MPTLRLPAVTRRTALARALVAALAIGAPTICAPANSAHAQSVSSAQFVNGITIPGNTPDLSTGSTFDRRLGFFSDIYYDGARNEFWGLSDRGPGGGVLSYSTRVERFTIDVNRSTGQISNFQVAQTILFRNASGALSGLAPTPASVLGNAFDPEGFVVNPATGTLLVSDEYGPSLVEFDRNGNELRRFTTPPNLIPRDGAGVPNFASDAGNVAGRTTNRGFEGLAISPDGKYAYAVLQSAMLDEGAGNGTFTRLVKFDVATGQAVGQFAYRLESAAQGRGVSALVALGNDKFLIDERNNRGVGVGATLTPPVKSVYAIDLAGATDISNVSITNGVLPAGVTPIAKGARVLDLAANTLPGIGSYVPEKIEGLAVGPRLDDGRYLMLAGTDNDYSVTQTGAGTQYDVYFDFTKADPYASSIQCPIGTTTGCVTTSNGAAATLTGAYQLLPGVLMAYAARIDGYVTPGAIATPEPGTVALTALGLGLVGVSARRRGTVKTNS